jgi:formamidopyrimidine-DNA glycosylase
MPELPEVRAHAERLTDAYGGRALERFTALSFTALKTATPPPESAIGNTLARVGTRGKLLVLDFAPTSFVVHLMQGGRLRPDESQTARPRGGLARWRFDDERALLLTEAGKDHKAGVWVREGDPDDHEPLDHLGPDADAVSVEQLATIIAERPSMRIHGFLRDQHGIAGLGRRLANEICHSAKISPFTMSAKLTSNEITALHAAIHRCIDESLAYERTRDDMSSSKERPGAVHHRTKEACPVCGDVIRAVEYNAYTVNYCATCQTGGKVLADNTTSRFLK